jgi:hypothetical protein
MVVSERSEESMFWRVVVGIFGKGGQPLLVNIDLTSLIKGCNMDASMENLDHILASEANPYPGFVRLPLEKSGVYLLINNGRVIYVGQSRDIFARISKHRNNLIRYRAGKPPISQGPYIERVIIFNEVWVQFAEIHELDRLEVKLIDQYQPKFNINLKRKHAFKIDLSKFGFDPNQWPPPPTKKTSLGLRRI